MWRGRGWVVWRLLLRLRFGRVVVMEMEMRRVVEILRMMLRVAVIRRWTRLVATRMMLVEAQLVEQQRQKQIQRLLVSLVLGQDERRIHCCYVRSGHACDGYVGGLQRLCLTTRGLRARGGLLRSSWLLVSWC